MFFGSSPFGSIPFGSIPSISGAVNINDERGSEIHGTQEVSNTRNSEIIGTNYNSDRNSEIHGGQSIYADRNTELLGKAELEISRIYRIVVKNGSGAVIGEFDKFRTLKFGKRLNNYGTASFEIPVNDDKASDLVSLRVYSVWIYRQEDSETTLVWAGEQAMRDCSLDNNGNGWVTIHCFTWFEQLKDRYTADEVIYTATDAGDIAWGLINTTQTQTNGSFGITEGSIDVTVDRDRSYYNQNVMEAIINLANVISGFDFEITDNKVFNVYTVMGSDKTDSVVLEYGHNIASVRITEDFVNPVNRGIALGVATDQTTLQRVLYNDAALQASNKVREGVVNEMDISESATLADKAEALVRKYGTKLLKVEPVLTKSAAINITDFGLGDVITLKVEYGIWAINEDYRVFEWEVTYNSDNSEDLALVLGNFTI